MPSDAERLTDLQYARAALVEAQDALFQLGPAHCTPVPSLLSPRPSFTLLAGFARALLGRFD
jgi:hypothetical protein